MNKTRMISSTVLPFLGALFISTLLAAKVTASNGAAISNISVPTTMAVGQTYVVVVTMINTGNTTWTSEPNAPTRLGTPSNSPWGIGRMGLSSGETVSPGSAKTFQFSVKAPSTPGTYDFNWQMVQENHEWFGDSVHQAVLVSAPTNGAVFVGQSVPTSMAAGKTYPVTISMKNTGNTQWVTNATKEGAYRLGSQNPQSNTTWGTGRIDLANGETVNPGATKTFSFNVTAPMVPGNYHMQWRMIQEGKEWFGGYSSTPFVTVFDDTPPTVSMTAPTAGTTIPTFGSVTVSAAASDNVAVTKVWFMKNGVTVATVTASPYTYNWDISANDNGTSATWTARAFDAAGNSTISVGVPVTITITGVYYVDSISGDDNNNGGTPATAWRSIAKVNGFPGFSPGNSILLKAGGLWREGLKIKTVGITIGAYGGSSPRPKLSGAIVIDNNTWAPYSGNIYKASIGPVPPTQVYVDDILCTVAREPNEGYRAVTSTSKNNSSFIDSNLASGNDLVGATFLARSNNWSIDALTVNGFTNNTITTKESLKEGPMGVGWGYILQNKLWMLDRAKEWYYDPLLQTLFLWIPNGDNPKNHVVEVSQIENVVESLNQSDVTVRDLAVVRGNRDDVHLVGNNIRVINVAAAGGGLGLYVRSTNAVVQDNSVDDTLWQGIHVVGPQSTVSNNHINNAGNMGPPAMRSDSDDYGYNPFGGIGLFARDALGGTVSNNVVNNSGYNGIRFDGENVVVSENKVDKSCLQLQDGGGIYVWRAAAMGSRITRNTVTNSVGNTSGTASGLRTAAGIYLDGNDTVETNVSVDNNRVEVAPFGIFVHNGFNNRITNNRVFQTWVGLGIQYDPTKVQAPTSSQRDTTYDNFVFGNIFSSNASLWLRSLSAIDVVSEFGTFNNNTYCHPTPTTTYAVTHVVKDAASATTTNLYNLAEWASAYGQDTESKEIIGACLQENPPVVTPTVKLTAVRNNGIAQLKWQTFNAESCTVGGGWSFGGNPWQAGLTNIGTGTPPFSLSCTNQAGTISRTVAQLPPGISTPVGVSATAMGKAFRLDWTANAGEPSYLVDVSTNGFFTYLPSWQGKDVGVGVSTVVTGLNGNTRYFARLRAKDGVGNTSGYSATVSTQILSTGMAAGFLDGSEETAPDHVDGARAFPSPFRPGQGAVGITFDRIPAHIPIRIYTIDGQPVATLITGTNGKFLWNLTNEQGNAVTSGVYLAMIEKGGTTKTLKVIVQK